MPEALQAPAIAQAELDRLRAIEARVRALLDRGADIAWPELRDAYQGPEGQQ
ncbi:hypothetical protein ACJ6WD_09620 [Streptomyces sp. VTCC 41912]|uniref:hypothetical protein n=1 Tax=Streptomyces sp. VTCC 41912 TaxID=3383243 RepID=UPI003896CD89